MPNPKPQSHHHRVHESVLELFAAFLKKPYHPDDSIMSILLELYVNGHSLSPMALWRYNETWFIFAIEGFIHVLRKHLTVQAIEADSFQWTNMRECTDANLFHKSMS